MIRRIFRWIFGWIYAPLWVRVATYNALAFFAGAVAVRCAQRHDTVALWISIAMIPWVTFWSCLTTGIGLRKSKNAPALADPEPYVPTNVIFLPTRPRPSPADRQDNR